MRDNTTASVEAIERAIRILDCFSLDHPEMGVADITRALGLKRSTVHRALTTMEAGGLLKQDPVTQKYGLGSKVLKLAHVLQSKLSLSAVALPYMRALRDRFNETVALHVVEGRSRVVVEQVESTHDVRRIYHEAGKPLPLHIGSSGKVILAFLPADEIHRVITEAGPDVVTGREPIDPEVLLRELEEIRRDGYCNTIGERSSGISSVSCPIRNREGRVVAAINISGPEYRFTRARSLACVPALRDTAKAISRELGFPDP